MTLSWTRFGTSSPTRRKHNGIFCEDLGRGNSEFLGSSYVEHVKKVPLTCRGKCKMGRFGEGMISKMLTFLREMI